MALDFSATDASTARVRDAHPRAQRLRVYASSDPGLVTVFLPDHAGIRLDRADVLRLWHDLSLHLDETAELGPR